MFRGALQELTAFFRAILASINRLLSPFQPRGEAIRFPGPPAHGFTPQNSFAGSVAGGSQSACPGCVHTRTSPSRCLNMSVVSALDYPWDAPAGSVESNPRDLNISTSHPEAFAVPIELRSRSASTRCVCPLSKAVDCVTHLTANQFELDEEHLVDGWGR